MHNYWLAGTTGIVDYTNYDDMKYAVSYLFTSMDYLFILKEALHNVISNKYLNNFQFWYFALLQIKKLDDSEFRNAFSKGYVRVCHEFDMFGYVTHTDVFLFIFI